MLAGPADEQPTVLAPPAWRSRLALLGRKLIEALPILTIGAIVGLIGLVVAMVERDEREAGQRSLIDATLWVEQAIEFQVTSLEDGLKRLALDMEGRLDPGVVAARAQLLVSGSPEILRLSARFEGEPAFAHPASSQPEPATVRAAISDALKIARLSGRPQAGRPIRMSDGGDAIVVLVVPFMAGGKSQGALAAEISLTQLLHRHVPWWVLQTNRVAIQDVGGEVLATKSVLDRFEPGASQVIALKAPLDDLYLAVAARNTRTRLLDNGIVAVVVIFGIGAAASLLAVHKHVRGRRQAEARLRAETAFRKAMEDSLTVGMRARDLEGRIIYVNPAFCQMVGYPEAELVGRGPPMPYWNPEDANYTEAVHDMILAGQPISHGFELRFRRSDGGLFEALVYEAPLIDADGRHTGWMGSFLDVTDRKRAEARARQQMEAMQRTARMVTMGETASTLAHELNQPLAAIASYAAGGLNIARSEAPDAAMIEDALDKIGAQAQRAGSIIGRTRDLIRRSEPRLAPLDMAEVVNESVGLIAGDLRKSGVAVDVVVDGRADAVSGDKVLLEQVLVNLIRNAVEAMATFSAPERVVRVEIAGEAERVVVSVADRGPGVPREVEEAMFSPFITTKPDGMGLGLNICRSIVEMHRGRLSYRQRPGGGAVFAFDLPRVGAPATTVAPVAEVTA
ncbi:MAG: PAS domain S-box protein [Hyphomicrobiaceae bacterium]|nr:PAS domain S-box protein [Hyphomicrobiaceae bacterium]